jgi:predicted  nucleic acid-binding Zn-ribbon protein
VVFDGGEPFYLPDTLGAPYLDYLLHRPNEPISAFDLEVAVSPEKGEVRARNSIQPESDARALAEYREELGRLQERRKELEAAGDANALEHLDNEVTALETALTASDHSADTGSRAFDNVRKAVATVRKHLRQGGPEERAFEEHLRSHLSIRHECMYSAPEGRVWV